MHKSNSLGSGSDLGSVCEQCSETPFGIMTQPDLSLSPSFPPSLQDHCCKRHSDSWLDSSIVTWPMCSRTLSAEKQTGIANMAVQRMAEPDIGEQNARMMDFLKDTLKEVIQDFHLHTPMPPRPFICYQNNCAHQ